MRGLLLTIALLALNTSALAEVKMRELPPDEAKPLQIKCLLMALDQAPKAFNATETMQLGVNEGEGITFPAMILRGRIVDQRVSYDVQCEGPKNKIKLTRFDLL